MSFVLYHLLFFWVDRCYSFWVSPWVSSSSGLGLGSKFLGFFSEIWSHILERYPCAFITRFFPSSISCFTHHHVLASIRSFITVSKHALCLVFRLWLHIHILGLLHSNHRRLGTASIVIVRRISSHGALLRAIARQPRIPHHRPKL